jgi:hypothetical protein
MVMKRFLAAVAVGATLFLAQACSSPAKSQSKQAETADPHAGHHMGEMKMPDSSTQVTTPDPSADPHAGHHMGHMTPQTNGDNQVKLTAPKDITPKTSIPLVINIQDKAGKAISSFDRFQEKQMHLIIVSDDLQFFSHLHPEYQGNGRFDVEASFPQPGNYTLFSDYKPTGQTEQVSVLKTQVSGNKSDAPAIDLSHTKTFGDTKVNLTFSEPTVKAAQEVTLTFNLQQASNNQSVTDLQTYLGERAHLVILRQSSPLTGADYIHAHAMKDTPSGQVVVMTQFPQPGKYKLWCQFNRNGRIITADFWVNVL